MKVEELQKKIRCGETSRVRFKQQFTSQKQIPGCIAGGYSVEEVMFGNSFARNPLMANFCAKTMPYRGLGSGIPRVLSEKCHVEFVDSKVGNQFTVRIRRPLIADETISVKEKARSNEEKSCSNDDLSRSNKGKSWSKEQLLLDFCAVPRSLTEISEYLGLKEKYSMKRKYIDPILNVKLRMTEPDSPNSPTQKYVIIDKK